jgi:hypothetical protein
MKKEDALRAILNEWRSLPEQERQTEAQLLAFAIKMANDPDYSFLYRGDRYQAIMGYLTRHHSEFKKLGL